MKTARLRLHDIQGEVTFEHVKFGYTPENIIHDFSAEVKPGQKIAIVGPDRSQQDDDGQSLMRFMKRTAEKSGSTEYLLRMCRVPMSMHSSEWFCRIPGSLKGRLRKISFTARRVSDDDVIKAYITIVLHHFIKTLPDGYDTVLNDKASLSEGQKQLMTIARAMILKCCLFWMKRPVRLIPGRNVWFRKL